MMDARRKILLVEDDQLDREAFLRFVEEQKLQYDCVAAVSVAEAKNLLASEPFDIVVCDYFLGDGTALEILSEIKDIPIVVITGVKDEDVAIRAWKGGAYDYITKSRQSSYLNAIPKTIENAIQRKTMEKALAAKRKSLEAIFDAVPVGMLLVDEHATVLRVNDAVRRIVGREYSQIINRQISDVLGCSDDLCSAKAGKCDPPCPACGLRDILERVLDSAQSVNEVEIRATIQRPGREIRPWFSVSARPATIDGATHIVVAVVDITDRKGMEHKLKEAMDLKSQFVSTVSHELRTPLTTIKEGLGLVLDGVAGAINQEQKKFLEIAKRNVDRLSNLINDVLDFQRLEAGRTKLDVSSNNIQDLLTEACEAMSLYAEKSQVHLECDSCQDLPKVPCDRAQIIQVLTNLIGNAIKFTPAGGHVSVGARRQAADVLISVRDTGIGISKEALPRIFERFYQVNGPDTKSQGTGLGLSIVHEIVLMHGGRIEVESAPDKGSTFTVFLPLNTQYLSDSLPVSEDKTLEEMVTK
jgi:signal transduction histidine kinase/DNA-binding NarL/FixJ family response regulator